MPRRARFNADHAAHAPRRKALQTFPEQWYNNAAGSHELPASTLQIAMINSRRLLALTVALVVAFAFAAPHTTAQRARAAGQRRVSLVLFNGKVFVSDKQYAIAQAVAIDGERIVAVGTDSEIKSHFTGAQTIDLQGRLVTPGFNDAHLHFLNGGLSLARVDLNGAKTLAEAKRRVAEKIKELPA
ncbi:MAG: hypothetical protein QOF61_3415, partial [Acidobacteriota bacterium]|nr:hypothetical protein [Acidobacteriota bacterium]